MGTTVFANVLSCHEPIIFQLYIQLENDEKDLGKIGGKEWGNFFAMVSCDGPSSSPLGGQFSVFAKITSEYVPFTMGPLGQKDRKCVGC